MKRQTATTYEAWIDVGGTFTDCFVVSPDSELRSTKVLSSGRVPIVPRQLVQRDAISAAEVTHTVTSESLTGDPPSFWCTAMLRGYDESGTGKYVGKVVGFEAGTLTVDEPIPVGQIVRFELDTGLQAPTLGIRRLLGVPIKQPLPPVKVRLGTTRGTNALLTRRGVKTALAVTAPFEDLLTIGDQTRPDLFALNIQPRQQLAEFVVGVTERLDASGQILLPVDIEATRRSLVEAKRAGCESLAICLMHSYANPDHERQVAEVAQDVGFDFISVSSQIAPLIEVVARAQTTVVDAYLSPIVRSYLETIYREIGGQQSDDLLVMTSAGGLVPWDSYHGKDSILSGPAGGVVALRGIAHALEIPELIGLDMGGTSTDVCRVGKLETIQYESTKAGVRVLTPTLPIETIAAGGGSVCWFDGVSLRVGPDSAGAMPGPACYGFGGPLTLTDVNLVLQRIPAQHFPFPLDVDAARSRLNALFEQSSAVLRLDTAEQLAVGLRRIACQQMAEAVRSVSIAEGADPRRHALVGFGGAAGQFVCEVADLLRVDRVIDSPHAGLMSALGMGLASVRRHQTISLYQLLEDVDWSGVASDLHAATNSLRELNSAGSAAEIVITYELRYAGTETSLPVKPELEGGAPETDGLRLTTQLRRLFDSQHEQLFGYCRPSANVELVALRLESVVPSQHQLERPYTIRNDAQVIAPERKGENLVLTRESLSPGAVVVGPATICNAGSTLSIDEGWQAELLSDATIMLRRSPPTAELASQSTDGVAEQASVSQFDPVLRDCFAQRLASIAEQMGIVLRQTSTSVNVKQRQDYSCAVFDRSGHLLANAAHVPVHLGAMGLTVRAVMRQFPDMEPGDVFITNDPYRGGSHLPDVTVITPVYDPEDAGRPSFFVANRAHHADIGGVAPGSMSVVATRLAEEGVLIAPMRLCQAGRDLTDGFAQLLESATWPPRHLAEVLSDVGAQRAANHRGAQFLIDYASEFGFAAMRAYAGHVLDAAEQRMRLFLRERFDDLGNARLQAKDYLDDGTPICVDVSMVGKDALRVDFTGTGEVSSSNFNANPSIVTAALLYALRLQVGDSLALNEGVLRCIELVIPPGLLNPGPAESPGAVRAVTSAPDLPAVAAGNVETSQRVVDVLLQAFGAVACSQGTMNNLLFGNANFGFYETIGGGSGASSTAAGASAVHCHMTNTKLTDPEVLEKRYPVRLTAFEVRRGSGGAGQYSGGDGMVREIEFLEPVQLSLLTSRRGGGPLGFSGGCCGAPGTNLRIRADGAEEILPASCFVEMSAGDRIRIETPGGGGYGLSRGNGTADEV